MVDYKKLNLKIGLEIHRQMDSHKLFCSCPSLLAENINYKIKRRLRAVTSELGEEDIVAKYEMGKNKYAIYEYSDENNCLVEIDEEPIQGINEDALDTVLIVAKMLNCQIIEKIQVMRKQVLDYSNTSGFQRTMLIAIDGCIETSKGKVGIQSVCLEEDAARKIKDEKNYVVYRLDRLGIPLIEVATAPDIKDPDHAREVAEFLGMLLKSTNRFKPGLGTIRQDLNLSIKNGSKVELKGVQDLRNIPKIIEKEVKRQVNLVENRKKVEEEVRRVLQDCSTEFSRPLPGSARMYVETDHPVVEVTKQRLNLLEIPELISDRAINFERKYKISANLAREIIKENIPFDYYAEKYKISAEFIAQVLIEMPKELKSRLNIKNKLSRKDFELVLGNLEKNKINKDAVLDILAELSKNGKVSLTKYKPVEADKIEEDIKKIIEKSKGLSFNAIMGDVMKKYHGKIDGKKAADIIKKYIK